MPAGSTAKRDPGKKKPGRGSVNNRNRLSAFTKGRSEAQADWGGSDAGLLQAVVVSITGLGGAVTFGLSRDNGAHSLTLMLDGNRETLWYNGDADLDDALQRVVTELEDLS